MENMRSGIGGYQTSDQTRIRKRSRKNKSKYSFMSVSARLNPDFDPRNIASPSTSFSNIDRSHEELDPKTMEFDNLVEFLHPTFIYDYLHKILHFLRSNQRELCFPNIAPYKEAFLLKIVQDNKYLRSRVFNEASVMVARQIIDVLEKNKYTYKWIHAYEDGLLTKNVLVYKKLSLSKEPSEQCKVPGSGTPSSEIASSLEDMSLSSQDRQEIPPSFKLTMLNTTLKFIKDDMQLKLEYPTMSFDLAQYVYSLIEQGNGDSNVGFGFKSLYAPLKEIMDSLKEKFEFKTSFVETIDRLAVRILLQKVPKTNETDSVVGESSRQTDLNSSNISGSSRSSRLEAKRLAKAQRDLISKQRIIELLPGDFARYALQRIVGFLEEPHEARVIFDRVTQDAGRFLEAATAIARMTELYRCFSGECVVLLKKLSRANHNATAPWKLRLNMGKVCKTTGLRTVTFYKTPSFNGQYNDLRNTAEESMPAIHVRNDLFQDPPSEPQPQDLKVVVRHQEERVVRQRSVSNDNMSRPTKSIVFQSAGAHVIDNTGVDAEVDVTDAGGGGKRRVAGRKGKLLEAMSTPMESDRAERMMRRMGWDGGALGARGEGIIEPIIPALHLAPGAGLGHMKPPPPPKKEKKKGKTNKERSVFRLKFLQELLTFIRTAESEKTMTFPEPLCKKEWRFLKSSQGSLNNRKAISLSNPEEIDLVTSIMLELFKDTRLQIEFQISEDKKELHFKKKNGVEKNGVVTQTPTKNKKKSKLEQFIDSEAYDKNTDLITQLNRIEQNTGAATQRAVKSLAYRVTLLEKIKEFVTLEKDTEVYHFDNVLNTKQRNFMTSVVADLNKRVSKSKQHGDLENKLFNEIRQIAGDCYLIVDISGQKITLQKKYYRKRFINSALGLPPPKSMDIKNTIIYKNNVIMCQGDAANIDYDIKTDNGIHNDGNISSGDNILNSGDAIGERNIHGDEKVTAGDDFGDGSTHGDEKITAGDNILNHDGNIGDNITHGDENITAGDNITRDDDFGDSLIQGDENISSDDNIPKLDDDIEDSDGDVLVISENHDINDDDDPVTNKTQETEKDSRVDEFTQYETTKDSLSLDVSNDSVLLNILEQENANEITTYMHKEDVKKEIMKCNGIVKTEVNNNHNVIKDRNEKLNLQDLVKRMDGSDSDLNNASFTSSKRSRSGSTSSHLTPKKCKYEKYISIISENNREITFDLVLQVQTLIANNINENSLPLLKCHGVKNGGLIYSCHSEDSFDWLKEVVSVASVKVVDTDYVDWSIRRMSMKINTLLTVDVQQHLSMLELYNPKLKTSGWIVMSEKFEEDYALYIIGLDKHSYNYICENCFSLYAGIDKVQFSIIWD